MNLTRSRAYRLVASCVSVVVLSSMVVMAVANPAEAASDFTTNPQQVSAALGDINACLSAKGSVLDVYYLFDTSGSLKGTDPKKLRLDALEQSVVPLFEAAKSGHKVSVGTGKFSGGASPALAWTELKDQLPVDFAAEVKSSIGPAADGSTNWPAGIAMARKAFEAKRIKNGNAKSCQVLVWATDGGIEMAQNTPAAASDGIKSLCGVGASDLGASGKSVGEMYELRNSGVVVVGLLLKDDKYLNNLSGVKSSQLSRMSYFGPVVEGVGAVDPSYFGQGSQIAKFACGKQVDSADGALIVADDAESLASQFWLIAQCVKDSCTMPKPGTVVRGSDGKWHIPVPQGISGLKILTKDENWSLVNPSGQECRGTSGCPIQPSSSNGAITVDVNVLNNAGYWLLTSSDPNTYWTFISGYSVDMSPKQIQSDDNAVIKFDLIQNGQPSTGIGAEVGLTAQIKTADGYSKLSLVKTSTGWQMAAPARFTSPGTIRTTLTVKALGVTSSSPSVPAMKMQDVEANTTLDVVPSDEYPRLISPKVPDQFAAFSTLEGIDGVATTVLTFQGPKSGSGKACIDGEPIVMSDSAQSLRAGSQFVWSSDPDSGCIDLAQGETKVLTLNVRNQQQADGLVRGEFMVSLASSTTGQKVLQIPVSYELPTTVVKNNVAYIVVLVLLMLLGLGLPYAALLYFSRRQATFSNDLNGVRYAAIPTVLGPQGIVSMANVDAKDFSVVFLSGSGIQREIRTGGETHRVIPPRIWPFKAIRTEVETSENSFIATNQEMDLTNVSNTAVSNQKITSVFYFTATRDAVLGRGDDLFAEQAWDESKSSQAQGPAQITGFLTVISPGFGDLAQLIESAKVQARVWEGWSAVHDAAVTWAAQGEASLKSISAAQATTGFDSPETTPGLEEF